jgi:2-dehydro-3-deoxyphosphogluconate aldolase/(4S)-4-hydroxy-2-oxoglutarate aldolase
VGQTAQVLERIGKEGVIAIVRATSEEEALSLALALADAGLGVVEVSYNTPGATRVLSQLRTLRPDVGVGAGTVLTAAQAQEAAQAGAQFLFSPVWDDEVDQVAWREGVWYIPGVFTAREVHLALQAGRKVLKVFPAATLGPTGLKALLEPFPEVRAIPTGGLSLEDVQAYWRAGAMAVGLGGALTRAPDLALAARQVLQMREQLREPKAQPS